MRWRDANELPLQICPPQSQDWDLVEEDDKEAEKSAPGAKKPRHRLQNEVATEKLIVESMGGKSIRRYTGGHKLGGLEWKDIEMAAAVHLHRHHHLEFAQEGLKTAIVPVQYSAGPLI